MNTCPRPASPTQSISSRPVVMVPSCHSPTRFDKASQVQQRTDLRARAFAGGGEERREGLAIAHSAGQFSGRAAAASQSSPMQEEASLPLSYLPSSLVIDLLGTLAAVLPLWCNPRLGAAGATRSQGGRRIGSLKRERSCVAKPGFERGCNQLALLTLWSQQRKTPTLGAEFSDCTV